jgi:radical SAM superfamily enzyme YgiQ (UPF0313 family)
MGQNNIRKLRVVLIKPSKFDDEGYVIRFWKGVLPSNTLNVLNGLTEDLSRRRVFGDLEIKVSTFDETVEKVPVRKIVRWSRHPETRLVVGLVGVQTNQFPRALEIGRIFRAAGIDVIMGGFHTSGTVNMLGEQEPDIQTLIRESIVVVSGEVEENWGDILADALHGRLKPIYSFAQDLQNLVDIGQAPPPVINPKTMKHFAFPSFGTLDTSRGCPFACSFCTIINVQGRKMRERSPEYISDLFRRNYKKGVHFYFFTDDNFARKKLWRETFEALIRLREEGIKIDFMMQVDLARKPKDFLRLAAEAGCTQVFIGMESVNPENLKAEGKGQNHVDEYAEIVREWHDAGVVVHAGYIIGLPFDTKEQVNKDIRYLMDVIQPDQASFFMLTPLPGSHDHREMKKAGEWMDPDFNKRDSFHATIKHPRMTEAYQNAWKTFYSKENMTTILSRWIHNPREYWNLMSIFFWYKNASIIEKEHPMIAGFFRLKDRKSRRPGFAVDPLLTHLRKRSKDILQLLGSWVFFLKEMEEVWLQTRKKSETEERWLAEIERVQGEIWRTLKVAEWQEIYRNARTALPARAKTLLDPFEELSSKILSSRKELSSFLEQWEELQTKMQDLRHNLAREGEAAQRWLDELCQIHKNVKPITRIHEWQEAYTRLKHTLPSSFRRLHMKFDAISNRVVYSRQDLTHFWSTTVEHVRSKRFRNISPGKLATVLVKDFFLTTSFASSFRAHMRIQ